ncbi:regulatory protein RecX [Cohnella sp. JJ-181]|uniref:regulatory protein RecX n=1 Tax=Cohnella rhizoplanae TaxID=2974897 RepID=UPI0022FF55F7|nr:RecX family transcriptional regulator [Cohnella sp. JJ-181]CAI6028864.1 Regulatory protein RecX [Cohnella sp. JJ-181]
MVEKKSEPNPADRIVDISEEQDWDRSRTLSASPRGSAESDEENSGRSGGKSAAAKKSRSSGKSSWTRSGMGANVRQGGNARSGYARRQAEDADDEADERRKAPASAVIAAVEADPKRPAMYKLAVAVDGESEQTLISVHEDTLVEWRLLKDRRLSPEEWEMLRKEQEKEEAYRSALYMLDFKARTQAELRRGLARKGYAPEAISGCLERLVKQGYVNDAVFAQRFTEQRVTGQKKGSRLVRQELMQRGIDKQEIEEAIRGIDDEAEKASALALAVKRWPSIKGKSEREKQMKLMNVLLRRGFPNAAAREAVRRATASAAEAEEWEQQDEPYEEDDFQ